MTPPATASRPASPYTLNPPIDFDGLSWPCKCFELQFGPKVPISLNICCFAGPGTRQRLDSTPEENEERLKKLAGAVRTILECVGEDPEREGLRETPERYAKAMLYFTKGYEENVRDLVNGAVFHEDHDELVIVKDIDVFSLCEHHMVPFTGKVRLLITCICAWRTVVLTMWGRCISVTSRIAVFWDFQNWHVWLRCSPADSRFKNV